MDYIRVISLRKTMGVEGRFLSFFKMMKTALQNQRFACSVLENKNLKMNISFRLLPDVEMVLKITLEK